VVTARENSTTTVSSATRATTAWVVKVNLRARRPVLLTGQL